MTEPLHKEYEKAYQDIGVLYEDAFSAVRQQNWQAFQKVGMPHLRQEDWQYTPIAKLVKQFSHVSKLVPQDASDYQALNESAYVIALQDGRIAQKVLPVPCQFTSFSKSSRHMPVSLESIIADETYSHNLRLLNNAFLQEGAVLFIPENTKLEVPVELFIEVSLQSKERAQNTRLVIVLAENASLDLIQHHQAECEQYFENLVTDIHLSKGATLNHTIIQNAGDKAIHANSVYVTQDKGSAYNALTLDIGGFVARHDVYVHLDGDDASVKLNGVYLGHGKQTHDNHSEIYHNADNTECREFYRGILDDSAKGVFNGKVIVKKGVKRTRAVQKNNNLLLSKKAEANTKPEMQIYAEDVECSHGATVGELDEKSLFYLQSRGISREEAKALLLTAFIKDVVKDSKLPNYEAKLFARLHEKIAPVDEVL